MDPTRLTTTGTDEVVSAAAAPAPSLLRFKPFLWLWGGVQSFLMLVYNITQVRMRQRLTPPRLLGRMNASIRFVVWGVNPIGALAAGALGTAIGIIPTMWIGVVGGIVAAGWVLFSPITRMRVLPTELAAKPE